MPSTYSLDVEENMCPLCINHNTGHLPKMKPNFFSWKEKLIHFIAMKPFLVTRVMIILESISLILFFPENCTFLYCLQYKLWHTRRHIGNKFPTSICNLHHIFIQIFFIFPLKYDTTHEISSATMYKIRNSTILFGSMVYHCECYPS